MAPVADPITHLATVADDLIDPRVGIIRYCVEQENEAGAPSFFRFVAEAANTAPIAGFKNFAVGSGAAATRERACGKAIGEAVERYCSAIFALDELPLCSWKKRSFPAIAPKEFALYRRDQLRQRGFPFVDFTEDTPVRWVKGTDLVTGHSCFVPAAMVYAPYLYIQGSGDNPIVQSISTGLACHVGPERALISAICEVIERDAFTLFWQARCSPPQILIETLSEANKDLIRRFTEACYDVRIFDLTTDVGISTILSVLRCAQPDAPPLVFAAATALAPEEAVRKSLEELAHTARYMQQLKLSTPPVSDAADCTEVFDQIDHLRFWCDETKSSLCDFVFASDRRIEFGKLLDHSTGSLSGGLASLVRKIDEIGHSVIGIDLTTEDVAQLGLSVVRAIVPGFHPLFMGFQNRALGGERLWCVPQRLGYSGIDRALGDNPLPHPFA